MSTYCFSVISFQSLPSNVIQMIIGTYKDRSSPNNDDSSSDESLLTPGGTSTEESDINLVGWIYVGSHNFTNSAWGSLSGSTASPVLNVGITHLLLTSYTDWSAENIRIVYELLWLYMKITNFEMGVILPLKSHAEVEAVSCWKRPARKYVDGVDRAWVSQYYFLQLLSYLFHFCSTSFPLLVTTY